MSILAARRAGKMAAITPTTTASTRNTTSWPPGTEKVIPCPANLVVTTQAKTMPTTMPMIAPMIDVMTLS